MYGSPRFSEDLDFSLFGVRPGQVKPFVEHLFISVLARMESLGIRTELSGKSAPTSGGYFGLAVLYVRDFPPVNIEINISCREAETMEGEVDSIAGDFAPAYTLYHLPEEKLVEEKIFGALIERKKPRDYYDLYYLLRKGMLSPGQKERLGKLAEKIMEAAGKTDFQTELGVFLPASQQDIIRNFSQTLAREMGRQFSLR